MIRGVAGSDGRPGNTCSPHLSRSFLKIPFFASMPRNNNDQEGNKCDDVKGKYGFRQHDLYLLSFFLFPSFLMPSPHPIKFS
jgi:hypothetical protein